MKRSSKVLKALISVWIVFHITVIVVLANGSSFFARRFSDWLLPYGNTLGLNSTWNFFSPDPAHTMYLQYRVRFEDEQGNELKEPIEGYLPPEKDQIVVDSSRRRFLYAMRFLLLEPSRMNTLMGPWLCKQYPGASEIAISHVLEAIPSLDVAITSPDTPVKDLKREVESGRNVFDCRKTPDEVAL
jgi:hypothetical protein